MQENKPYYSKEKVLHLFGYKKLEDLHSDYTREDLDEMHETVYGIKPLPSYTDAQIVDILYHRAKGPKEIIHEKKYKKSH